MVLRRGASASWFQKVAQVRGGKSEPFALLQVLWKAGGQGTGRRGRPAVDHRSSCVGCLLCCGPSTVPEKNVASHACVRAGLWLPAKLTSTTDLAEGQMRDISGILPPGPIFPPVRLSCSLAILLLPSPRAPQSQRHCHPEAPHTSPSVGCPGCLPALEPSWLGESGTVLSPCRATRQYPLVWRLGCEWDKLGFRLKQL